MDGYVDLDPHGVTELRVHGVSGTSPQAMLGNPHVQRVAGDEAAGFYRRVWLEGVPTGRHADAGGRRREAYSWGGMTSGSARQALWLLLLPFTLVNVAFWMWPGDSGTPRRLLRDAATALQRLFALSLTVMFVLTVVVVADDLLGWQCASDDLTDTCVAPHGFLHVLSSAALEEPGRRLAVTTLAPVGMVVLLWALGRATWHAHERHVPPASGGASPAPALAHGDMWNGSDTVRRLRAVHVSVGLAVPGIFLVAPLRASSPAPDWHQDLLLLVMLLYAAGCAGALLVPGPWRREAPAGTEGVHGRTDDVTDLWRVLPWPGVLLLVLAVLSATSTGLQGEALAPALPYLSDTLVATYYFPAALLVALLVLTGRSAYDTRRQHRTGGLPGRALWGLGLPVVLMLAWVIAGALSAGVVIRVADYLGTPVPLGRTVEVETPLRLSPGYDWAAAATVCLVVALLVVVGCVAVLCWRNAKQVEADNVRSVYRPAVVTAQHGSPPVPEDEVRRRLQQISRTWAVARLTEHAPLLLGVLAWVLATSVAIGSTAYWFADRWTGGQSSRGLALSEHAPWLVTAGSWAIGVLALAVLGLARSAYRSPGVRRTVGILWDLGTFWPRATHPLAPPCYMERALPDLCDRIQWLTRGEQDLVVLSTHSQGTVMAAAVVLQSRPEQRAKLSLLTYGSPLQRLYQRFFPAYFGADALEVVHATLRRQPAGSPSESRWRNLYRSSDPIGGPVLATAEARVEWYGADVDAARRKELVLAADVDLNLLDPLFPRPEGDPAYPSALRHSDYFRDPYFEAAVDVVIDLAHAQDVHRPAR